MKQPVFITGIGTGVGKTLVSAIVANALQADYWKPVQAGFEDGTDSEWMESVLPKENNTIHKETYKLKLPASPHIAAREEGIRIHLEKISDAYRHIRENLPVNKRQLVIEGAGGLMVPLNENDFVADLVKKLSAKLIIVSRNYLGSINHSLLTAAVCRKYNIDVIGWIFNDQFMDYEEEIVEWSGYPKIASIPFCENPGSDFIAQQGKLLAPSIKNLL
jgi:dethiobiotin synthetase